MRFQDLSEGERRALKQKARSETLLELWEDIPPASSLSWNERAATAVEMLRGPRSVTDIGCGAMTLKQYLPASTVYIPVDCVKRDERTVVVDLNRSPVPGMRTEAATLLGVLEYIQDVPKLIAELAFAYPLALISYNAVDYGGDQQDALWNTWVNGYSSNELEAIFERSGWQLVEKRELGSQGLWLLASLRRPPLPEDEPSSIGLRRSVLTIATADFAGRWRFCLDSQRRYCERQRYAHLIIDPPAGELHPKWAKLDSALRLIETGHVFLVDADCEFTLGCPAFETVLDAHPFHDIFFVNGISGRPNTGALILRGGRPSLAAAFLRECLASRHDPVPPEDFVTSEGENGHVISILKRSPYRSRAYSLPLAWNCSLPDHAAEAYILHYTNHLRAWFERQSPPHVGV